MTEVKLGAATVRRIEESYEPNFDAKVFFPDWRPEVDDEHEDFDDLDEDATGPVVVTGKPSRARSVAVVTSLAEEDEPDYLDVDVVEGDDGGVADDELLAHLRHPEHRISGCGRCGHEWSLPTRRFTSWPRWPRRGRRAPPGAARTRCPARRTRR